jgi:DNA-binding CsgD family transcriptional regulator
MEFDVIGLSEETQRVYAALVGLPRSTAAELGEACGSGRGSVVQTLTELVRRGLAVRTTGRPTRYTAGAPDVAVGALLQERQRQLDAARALAQRLTERHREALRIGDPDIAVELLTGPENISAAVRRLADGALHQVRAFDRPPYVDRPGSNLEEQRRRQRTGILHRVVYDRAAVAWPGRLRDDILPSVRAGEQARTRTDLPLKMVIADDRGAIIPFSLAPGGTSAAHLVHRSPMLVALEALFEAEWARAVPVLDTTAPADDGAGIPDADTLALVRLLASGCTDAAVARTQGWSQRTTQRRIQRLLTELGAATRFQAATQAALRGWLG